MQNAGFALILHMVSAMFRFSTHAVFLPDNRKAQNHWVKRGRNPLSAIGGGRVCVSTGHLLVWMMENKAILAHEKV